MSQLSIKLSDKADALIAQLQKEIFNRRRKKVTAAGVVESLVESGARSQSDKRFATSWTNLIQDIEKAAKLANAHGSKPSSLTDEEWVMVLSHRARAQSSPVRSAKKAVAKTVTAKKPAAKRSAVAKTAAKTAAKKPVAKKPVVKKAVARKAVAQKAGVARSGAATATTVVSKPRPARRARKTAASGSTSTSVAKRMAKAAGRLASGGSLLSTTAGSNGINSPARS
jgi:septal ring-binding cell division protein DamX